MKAWWGFALPVSAALLGGCISYTVDEGWFFRPRPNDVKATTPAELKLTNEDYLRTPGNFSRDFGRVFPNFADRMPAKITHDFVAIGDQRIAVTRIAGANGSADEPLLVACMGQTGDRRNSGVIYAAKLLPWGEALLIDYPGYGDSSGEAKIDTMLAFQRNLPAYLDGIAANRPLILWGHSLGGPVCASVAAASKQADAVVLETTVPTFEDMMDVRKPWFTPPNFQLELATGLETYDIPATLADFSGPILVIGAGKDQAFPVALEREVAERLKQKNRAVTYVEYEAADHMNAALNGHFVRDAAGFFAGVTNSRH